MKKAVLIGLGVFFLLLFLGVVFILKKGSVKREVKLDAPVFLENKTVDVGNWSMGNGSMGNENMGNERMEMGGVKDGVEEERKERCEKKLRKEKKGVSKKGSEVVEVRKVVEGGEEVRKVVERKGIDGVLCQEGKCREVIVF